MSLYLFGLEIEMRHYLYILQVLLSEGMFAFFFRRKRCFLVRLFFSLSMFLLLSFFVPALLNPITRYNLIVVYLFSLPVFPICFSERFEDMFFCCTAAMIIQNISYNSGLLCCILFGLPPEITASTATQTVQLFAYILVHTICLFLCVMKLKNKQKMGIRLLRSSAMALVSFMTLYVLEGAVQNTDHPYDWPIRTAFVLVDILVLIMLFGLRYIRENEEDKRILQQLINQEYEQFKMQEDTIELLRMKSHDIKHIITLLKASNDSSLNGAIAELEDVNARYNNIVRTGNPTLDVILTEKKNVCYKNRIKMTYTVDGSPLQPLPPEAIAAIFSNLLDNAIQYLITVDDPEKRLLRLTVQKRLSFIIIHVENYCVDARSFSDGIPDTTKGDAVNHGYGLKSVRYVVKKYNGTLTIRCENKLFCVDISLPDSL